jgi:hypothetical protein
MRGVVCGLCGACVVAIAVGCYKFEQKSTPSDKVEVVPSKPEKSIPADTAGEPDKILVEAGRQQLKDKYTPMPVYSRKGALGIIRLTRENGKLEDAIVILQDRDLTDSYLKLENGYVFFNVDKTGPVKVGDFELKKGECVLFDNGKLSKLDIVVSVK